MQRDVQARTQALNDEVGVDDAADTADRQRASVGAEGQPVDVPVLLEGQAMRATGFVPECHGRFAAPLNVLRSRSDRSSVRTKRDVIKLLAAERRRSGICRSYHERADTGVGGSADQPRPTVAG